jgi:hypothetical protein
MGGIIDESHPLPKEGIGDLIRLYNIYRRYEPVITPAIKAYNESQALQDLAKVLPAAFDVARQNEAIMKLWATLPNIWRELHGESEAP